MTDILDQFRAAARATDEEELVVRREANARIAALERARAHAYRRLDFVGTLDDAARTAATHEAAVVAQQRAVLDRFGWSGFDSEPRRAIGTAIAPFLLAVAAVHHGEAPEADEASEADTATASASTVAISAIEAPAPDLPAILARFETWYRDAFGSEFWTLSDHFFPDTPLVDF